MLVWFTDKDGNSIAIDSRHLVAVYTSDDVTAIKTVVGAYNVKENILDVVSRFNTAE
jgi:predicted metalloendopeptidase